MSVSEYKIVIDDMFFYLINTQSLLFLFVFFFIFQSDSREAAFVYAISAAGVAYSVTRACARGELNDCSCDNRVRTRHPRHWQWGGCSEVRNPSIKHYSLRR